jgi:DNA-binding FadR family transcriptional regulator
VPAPRRTAGGKSVGKSGGRSGGKASESIAEQIRADIATGRLKPGQMLPPESALLEQYEVARATMREALRILESDGLLTIRRGIKGGARVQAPELPPLAKRIGLHLQLRGTTLQHLTDAQVALHPQAAAMAAIERTDEDLAELRASVGEVAVAEGIDGFLVAVERFSEAIFQAAHNPVLMLFTELTSELWRHDIRVFAESVNADSTFDSTFFQETAAVYGELVDAIEAGDATGAGTFWHRYMQSTGAARQLLPAPLSVYEPRKGRRPARSR